MDYETVIKNARESLLEFIGNRRPVVISTDVIYVYEDSP